MFMHAFDARKKHPQVYREDIEIRVVPHAHVLSPGREAGEVHDDGRAPLLMLRGDGVAAAPSSSRREKGIDR